MRPETALHVVHCIPSRRNVHLGVDQCRWLVEKEIAEYTGLTREGHYYVCKEMTTEELDALIMSVTEIRACDFCHRIGAPWGMKLRPYLMQMGETVGRVQRDAAICDRCEPLVRRNDRRALVEVAIEGAKEKGLRDGGYQALVVRTNTSFAIRKHLTPVCKKSVEDLMRNRRGPPFRV